MAVVPRGSVLTRSSPRPRYLVCLDVRRHAMSVPSRVRSPLTLEQFLKLPDIDEHPAREYIDGKVEEKVAAQKKHCMIQKQLVVSLDAFAEPTFLGTAFPELRCTFAGRSIVPDVVFLLADH